MPIQTVPNHQSGLDTRKRLLFDLEHELVAGTPTLWGA
ncbi:MAG: hypothetical protein QOJ80_4627 [Mycobacterium sp.]|jgi:hypothetical protein|nr:hypothetical protein [Mycobacterium sp.]